MKQTIGLWHAVALYAGAVLGAGVLILPGVTAEAAGPASLLSWAGMGLLGLPLALTFARLSRRRPDAGGVSSFARSAFGSAAGTAVGWFYFVAGSTGQAIVSLTGAYYVTAALGAGGRAQSFLVAAAILVIAVLANLAGLRFSGRIQLGLSLGVGAVLVVATVAGLTHSDAAHFQPFAPHGVWAAGTAAVPLFFAFAGWEAITHLSEEFRSPQRDIMLATVITVAVVLVLYFGVAVAVVATHTYGSASIDRTAVAQLLGSAMGTGAKGTAAIVAVVVSTGTANVFVAATSRLGYSLGREHAFPISLAQLDTRGVPRRSVVLVGGIAALTLAGTSAAGLGADDVVVVPSALVIATYVIGMAAAVRLLEGKSRALAAVGLVVCLGMAPFAGAAIAAPAVVAAGAVGYTRRPRAR